MNKLRWVLGTLALLAALVGGPPARATDDGLPPLASLRTVREQTLLTFNGRPLQVCQREWQSWNRVHGTCRDLATAAVYDQRLIAGTVVEFVLFDGRRYERVNDQASWTSTADEGFAPDVPLEQALFTVEEQASVTPVGQAEVGGVAAVQYQLWVTDDAANEEAGGQIVHDLFISGAGYVLQSQASVRGTVPGLGDGALSELRTYSDFNAPIVVAPPQ